MFPFYLLAIIVLCGLFEQPSNYTDVQLFSEIMQNYANVHFFQNLFLNIK